MALLGSSSWASWVFVCFTTKLKILSTAGTSHESFAQHWHSHRKKTNYTNTECFPESGLPYSQRRTAELGPHVMSDAPWSSRRGTFHLAYVNESVPLKIIYFLERSSVFY